MTIKVRIAGVLKNVVSGKVRIAGVNKDLVLGYVMKNGQLKEFFNAGAPTPPPASNPSFPPEPVPGVVLTVNITPSSLSAMRSGAGVAQTVDKAKAVVSNGVAPYTYAWSLVTWENTNGTSTPSADTPTAVETSFSQNLAAGQNTTAQFKCVVKDANGNVGAGTVWVGLVATNPDTTGGYEPPTRPPRPPDEMHEF